MSSPISGVMDLGTPSVQSDNGRGRRLLTALDLRTCGATPSVPRLQMCHRPCRQGPAGYQGQLVKALSHSTWDPGTANRATSPRSTASTRIPNHGSTHDIQCRWREAHAPGQFGQPQDRPALLASAPRARRTSGLKNAPFQLPRPGRCWCAPCICPSSRTCAAA
jgi:hypothetical protein